MEFWLQMIPEINHCARILAENIEKEGKNEGGFEVRRSVDLHVSLEMDKLSCFIKILNRSTGPFPESPESLPLIRYRASPLESELILKRKRETFSSRRLTLSTRM